MKLEQQVPSSLLNLRNLAAGITLVLLLCPLSLCWLDQPNHFFFKVGAQLTHLIKQESAPVNPLVKILVPQAEMDRLVKDLPGALGMGDLLQGLHGVFVKGVLLVIDELPNSENYATDVLVNRLVNDSALRESMQASGVLTDIEALGQRRDNFYSQVLDGSLLLGITQTSLTKDKVNYLREATLVPFQKEKLDTTSAIYSFFEPAAFVLANFRFESKTPGYAAYSNTQPGLAYPLLWRVGNDYFPDAILALLKKTQGANHVSRNQQNIILDDKSLAFSTGAVIYPLYSSQTGLSDSAETVLLSDLKSPADYNRFYNKTVIIGVKDSRQVSDIAAAYYSLDKRAYYTVPEWYLWAEKAGLLLLLMYLFLLLPLLPVNIGLTISAVIGVTLLAVQLGFQVSQMQWLPVGLLILYLVVGHGCALLWMLQKKVFNSPAQSSAKRTNAFSRQTVIKQKAREEPRPSKFSESTFAKTLAFTKKDKKFKLGRYEVDSELGRGAMGVVYLGHDSSIDRKVAIKTLNYAQFPKETLPEVKERFFREAKAAGNLKHQNIVTIYEMAEDAERAFIAMEYVGGQPLSAYTKKGNLLPVDEVYWIVACVAEALGYAHDHNIVHRDIKPSNILYDRERQEVKVADFGIARITDNASTKTGDILGSPLYMSPEQIKGEKVSGQTDIFSLGITFYQLLTGELPFNGDSMVAITHQIVNGKFIAVTDINPKLPDSAQRIIAKALQKNPEKRFETAREMMEMLDKYRDKG